MAGPNDGFLRSVPSDTDLDDGRLYDPTLADGVGGTVTGTLSLTTDNATLVASASAVVTGVLAASLAAATLNADADAVVTATLAATLDAATLVGDADATVAATLSATLDAATLLGSATVSAAAAVAIDPGGFRGGGAPMQFWKVKPKPKAPTPKPVYVPRESKPRQAAPALRPTDTRRIRVKAGELKGLSIDVHGVDAEDDVAFMALLVALLAEEE